LTGLTSESVLAVLEVLSLCREGAQGIRARAERALANRDGTDQES